MSSFICIDNKGKDILILGLDPMQGLGENSLTAEKIYSINFTIKRNFVYTIMDQIVIYLLMEHKFINL